MIFQSIREISANRSHAGMAGRVWNKPELPGNVDIAGRAGHRENRIRPV